MENIFINIFYTNLDCNYLFDHNKKKKGKKKYKVVKKKMIELRLCDLSC